MSLLPDFARKAKRSKIYAAIISGSSDDKN
jgi:hypothetical protein